MTKTVPQLISEYGQVLEDVGIDRGRGEVEMILCHLLDCDRLNLHLNGEQWLDSEALEKLDHIVLQRKSRYPLQYILEESWFYGRSFFVSPSVMVPTPETELLCETAIRFVRQAGIMRPRIFDMGVGSGVISVTMAAELDRCEVLAVDASTHALNIAAKNSAKHEVANRIEFRQSNFLSALKSDERFDLILSNPPYISDDEYRTLPPEVLADPKLSLTSGVEGLDAVQVILTEAPKQLRSGGRIMFEIGYNQALRVMEMSEKHSAYDSIIILQDLNGIDRVAVLSCRD